MNVALKCIAGQGAQRALERQLAVEQQRALNQSSPTQVSESARPWWHRAGAALLASLLWFNPIAITPQLASRDAGDLVAGKTYLTFWQHVLPLRVSVGIQAAMAAPIADPNAPIQFQPKVLQSTGAGGGVPVVNITAPNGAGISLNKYRSFNVDAAGLILNNSLITGTALTGGMVQANRTLNGRTASVILNEVTSLGAGYQSVLNGPLEVFGAPATVIVANPNGIAVRGASVTNTIGVMLSTGIPQFVSAPNGSLTTFEKGTAIRHDVTGGHIQIDGNPTGSGPATGIDGTVGHIDLIGETIGINAPLYVGNSINVIAGRQFVTPSAATATGNAYATAVNGSSNSRASIDTGNGDLNTGYAIDATAFGAITAGQIQIVSTSAGMGVRSDGQLAANAGDVLISANGDLSVAGTHASQRVDLKADGSLAISGAHIGSTGVSLSAGADLKSTGVRSGGAMTATAGGDLSIAAARSESDMALTATNGDLALSDIVASLGKLRVSAGKDIGTSGVASAVSGMALSASRDVSFNGMIVGNAGGTIRAGRDIGGAGTQAFRDNVIVEASRDVSLTGSLLAKQVDVSGGNNASVGGVASQTTLTVSAQGNAGGGDASITGGAIAPGAVTLNGARDVSVNGSLSSGDAKLSADRTVSLAGTSTVAGEVTLNGKNIRLAGSLQGTRDVMATATGAIDASALSLIAANNATFNGGAVSLGNLMVGGGLHAAATSTLSLSGSQMFVVGDAKFQSRGAFSKTGKLLARAIDVQSGSFANGKDASIASTTTARIRTDAFSNSGVISARNTSVISTTLSNTGGTLVGVNALSIDTGTFDNTGGIVAAGDPTSTNAIGTSTTGTSTAGTSTTSGDLSLAITAAGSAYANAGGELIAQRNLRVDANKSAVDVSQGAVRQGGALSITADKIAVSSTWNYGGQSVAITGLSGIVNTGTMSGTTALNVTTGGTFSNAGKVIANDLTLDGALSNAAGALFHATDTLTLNGSVTNRGTVEANTLNLGSGYYDNQQGLTQSVGAMTFAMGGGALQNTGGKVLAGSDLTINAGAVINDQSASKGSASSSTTIAITDPSLLWSGSVGKAQRYYMQMVNQGSGVFNGQQTYRIVPATMADLLTKAGVVCVNPPVCTKTNAPIVGSGSIAFNKHVERWDGGQWNSGKSGYQLVWDVGASALPWALASATFTLPTVYRTTTVEHQGTAGVISAGRDITVNARSLSNKGGQISAQHDIPLNVQTLTNGVAAPTLTATVTNWIDQGEYTSFLSKVQALGTVGAHGAKGCKYGTMASCGEDTTLPPTVFRIDPSSTAPTASGATTASGSTGMIVAGNNLSVSGGALVNAGLMVAANDVVVSGGSLSNQGGNSQGASSQAGCGNGIPNKACGNGGAMQGGDPSRSAFGYTQSDATIFAGHDLVVAAGDVSNAYGNLIAGHDLVVGGEGTSSASITPAQSLANTSGNIVAGNDITLNTSGAVTNALPSPTLIYKNFGSGVAFPGCMTAGGYKNGYCEAYFEQQSGSASTISAGNTLSVRAGTLSNVGSLITAGTSATIDVQGPIFNSAQTLNAYWHSHWTQETGLFSSDKTHDVWACGSAAECARIYGRAYTGGGINPPTPIGNLAATIQAPNLSMSSSGQIQNVGNIIGTRVTLTGQTLINGITAPNTYTPSVYAPSQVISLSPLTMPSLNISVPRTSTSTSTSTLPTSTSTSTSTNGQAVYVDGQLGSASIGPQDLLDNLPINLKPSSTVFFYNPDEENVVLQQAALQQTGKASFIHGLTYDTARSLSVMEQEKAILYANAIDFAKANDFQLGTALTQTQVNELTKPMLWYVEQTVPDPQCRASGIASCPTITALMPQVVLPSGISALSAGGNIEGTDVTLSFGKGSGGSIQNTGDITATDTLTVNTDSLTNQANQVNVGNLWNSVKGGYTDTTGMAVQPGGFMSAANLDLNVQTLAQIGGALQKLNSVATVDQADTAALIAGLQQRLGGDFTQTTLADQLDTSVAKQGGAFGATQLFAIVAAVVLTIVTYGAASAAIGAAAGATEAGSSAAIGAAGTSSMAVAAAEAGGTFMAATAGASAGLANIALSAGAAGVAGSLASQIIATEAVNWGDVGKAGLVSALTAGLTNGLTYSAADGLGFTAGATTAANPSIASLAGVQTVGGAMVPQAGKSAGDLASALVAMGGEAAIQAGANSAIHGGSFLDALKNSAVSDLAAAGAFAIGDAFRATSGPMSPSSPLYALTHAALGCATSAMQGTECAGGAIGGALSAGLNPIIDPNRNMSPVVLTAIETLVSGSFAGGFGFNVQAAVTAAQNETLNNWLNHTPPSVMLISDQQRYDSAVAACRKSGDAACQTAKELESLSRENNARLKNACAGSNTQACAAAVSAGLRGGNDVRFINGAAYAFDPDAPTIKAVDDPYPALYANSFDGRVAQSTLDGLQMAPVEWPLAAVFGVFKKWLGFGTADASRVAGPMTTSLDVSAGATNSGMTKLFRAVQPAELDHIANTGALENLGRGSQGKYFTTDATSAAFFAKQAVLGFGDPPYTMISTEVPNRILELPGVHAEVDRGISAVVIPNENLPGLVPTIHNYFPIPPPRP